jgi:hypothetical protein
VVVVLELELAIMGRRKTSMTMTRVDQYPVVRVKEVQVYVVRDNIVDKVKKVVRIVVGVKAVEITGGP